MARRYDNRKLYYWLMGSCLVLIGLAWFVVRRRFSLRCGLGLNRCRRGIGCEFTAALLVTREHIVYSGACAFRFQLAVRLGYSSVHR